jgi:hypothetical protein
MECMPVIQPGPSFFYNVAKTYDTMNAFREASSRGKVCAAARILLHFSHTI